MPCAGRVEVRLILEAFLGGADGVLVLGCEDGDCRFQLGPQRARPRVALARARLADAGIAPERLELRGVEASNGARLAALVNDFTARIRALGPWTAPAAVPGTEAAP
jgi:coenzyme F420-reducing hydrogenase delta subunit